MPRGTVVGVDSVSNVLQVCGALHSFQPVALTARLIFKGESVKFDEEGNTDDLLRFGVVAGPPYRSFTLRNNLVPDILDSDTIE